MSWWLIPGAYLVGSISFSLLLVARLEKKDIRGLGSGNAGATNVLRVSGAKAAVLTLLLDIAKGVLPVWLGLRLGVSGAVLGGVAVAVVVGHVFPIYHGFRGGKGVATAAGSLGALEPRALVASMLVFVAVLLVTRFVSIASILGVASFPVSITIFATRLGIAPAPQWMVVASTTVALLVFVKHHTNLARLIKGTERRVDAPRESR
jgi:glycerol-3-phosphate acyltransferase PlsY